jgi:hypothetical protein
MNRLAMLKWSLFLVALASAANAQQAEPKPSIWDDATFVIAISVLAIATIAALGLLVTKVIEALKGTGKDPETRQLHFAAVTLSGLGLVFLLSMAMYYWPPRTGSDSAKDIFDASKTIIPPIVTLVLGYYFGKRSNETPASETTADKPKP